MKPFMITFKKNYTLMGVLKIKLIKFIIKKLIKYKVIK